MTDTEEGAPGFSPTRLRSFLRWLVGGLSVLGVAVLALGLAVRTIVDAGFLERRLNTALDAATDGRYRGEIEAVRWNLLARSLRIEGTTLHPDSQALEGADSPVSRQVRATVPEIRLTGVHPWALLWSRALIVDAVAVFHPRVQIRTRAEPRPEARSSAVSSVDSVETLPNLRVHRFRIEDGTLTRAQGEGPPTDSLWGLSMQFDRLSTDSAAVQTPGRFLADRFLEGSFEGVRRVVAGGAYVLRLGPGRVSRRDSLLRVQDVHFAPAGSDAAFMRRHEYRVHRFRTRAERVEVVGFDYRRFVEAGALHAARVRLDALNLDVYRDNHLPERPNDPPPPMPQDALEMLNRSLRIDTIRVRDSRIGYTKRPEGVPKSGSIWFEDLWASLYNVTNDSEQMTASTPMVIEARTRVNGAGRLRITLRIPLRAPHLALSFEGRLGAMDAPVLNETFVPLGGVRIESGHVDSLWFQADVQEGVARGSVGSVYRNLEVETLDEATGDRGIGHRLKTVATGLALRSDNVPKEGDLETGQIQHAHAPDNSFFKFLWHALRSGIYSLVGIDRLPR